jgi:hypothetical protein
LYPIRFVTGHAAGQTTDRANLEFFQIKPDGTRVLINDTTNPDSLKAFRARTFEPTPEAPKFNPVVRSSTNAITLSWTGTGTLEESSSLLPGSWTNSPSQSNPQNVPTTEPMKFYRIRQ